MMKKNSFNLRISFSCFAFFTLLFFMVQPTTMSAQKPLSKPKCSANVVGFADGYVIFACAKKGADAPVCAIKKEQCECAVKNYKGAKGCIDGNGVIMKTTIANPNAKVEAANEAKAIDPVKEGSNDGGEEPVEDLPSFQRNFLTGQTNCRLNSETGAYITLVKGGIRTEIQVIEGGNDVISRFDFKAVEGGDHSKGFYILTREDTPRALMAEGATLSLRAFNTMDGKMREMSQWKFFITGSDDDGNTEYQLMPVKNSGKLVLAEDTKTKDLILTKKGGDDNSNSLATRGGAPEGVLPSKKSKKWNCECVF